MEQRNVCIICNSKVFQEINSFPNFPIMAVSNNTLLNILVRIFSKNHNELWTLLAN